MNKYYKPFEELIQDFKTNPDKYSEEDKVAASLSVSDDDDDDESKDESGSSDESNDDIKPVKTVKQKYH